MMKQCEKCVFYDKEKDDLHRKYNCISDEDVHYCIMYDDHIPKEIVNDEADCKESVVED